jgi:hypothetical protein
MDDPRATIEIQWQGIAVTIHVARNWLNTGFHHIEVKANQSLPITNTGYSSRPQIVASVTVRFSGGNSSINHVAQEKRLGTELMVLSDDLELPLGLAGRVRAT